MAKKKVDVDVNYNVKGADKVEDSFDGVAESADKASESVDKVGQKTGGLKGAFQSAQGGVKGLLGGFKAIIANPIGAVIAAVVAAVKLLSEMFSKNEAASNKVGQGFAYLKGLLKPLEKAFFAVFDAIVFAIEKPGEAWDAVVDAFDKGFKFLDKAVWQPMKATFTIVVGGIEAGILKMRIAWNNFTGDAEEAQKLTGELETLEAELLDAAKVIEEGSKEIKGAFTAIGEAIVEVIEEADAYGDALAELTRREQNLTKARREQEIQNAKSLAQLESLKVIRDDESKSLEERIAANEKIAKIEANRVTQGVKLAQQELQLLKDRAALEGEGTEILDQITEKEIQLAELRNENAGIRAEQITNDVNLRKEQFDKEAALIENQLNKNSILEEDAIKLADAKVMAEQLKIEKLKELGLEENQIFLDQQNALDVAILEAQKARIDKQKELDAAKKEQDKKDADDAVKLAEQTAKQKADIEKQLGSDLLSFSESLTTALGEDSKAAMVIQKTTALGEIAVNTAKAISSLVAASSANPANSVTFGAAGIAQYAAGILQIGTNMAAAYKLLKEPAPKIDGGESAGGSAPSTEQTSPSLGVDNRTTSERFGADLPPIRAYVTESEITNSQNNASNIQNLSEIG